eukprot:gb/GEZN01001102.1/.p1 GENE.gb/GEZN01001102.1/~~gb/GEZN01001102.1/.p1  ORF type:complete len:993 (+),score=113.13 gb/GEZN01001102.1/:188-3166(+)
MPRKKRVRKGGGAQPQEPEAAAEQVEQVAAAEQVEVEPEPEPEEEQEAPTQVAPARPAQAAARPAQAGARPVQAAARPAQAAARPAQPAAQPPPQQAKPVQQAPPPGLEGAMAKLTVSEPKPAAAEGKGEEEEEVTWLTHAKRPGPGKLGTPFTVRTNMFQVQFAPNTPIYLYRVDFDPEIKSRVFSRAVLDALIAKDPQLRAVLPVFDGKNLMWTCKELAKSPMELTITEDAVDEHTLKITTKQGKPQAASAPADSKRKIKSVNVVIAATIGASGNNRVDLQALQIYLEGKSTELPRSALQALDCVTRQYSYANTHLYHPMGRSVFSPQQPQELGGGAVLWQGHFQSLRATQLGLMLNRDLSAVAMAQPGPVTDFVLAELGKRSLAEIKFPGDLRPMAQALKGLKVEVSHRKYGVRRPSYRVVGLDNKPAHDQVFEYEGERISVAAYFNKVYKIKLQYPGFPCLLLGSDKKHSCVPMEVCTVVKALRYNQELNLHQRTKMLDYTSPPPAEREKVIVQSVPDLTADPHYKQYHLSVSRKMTVVPARILTPPQINYLEPGGGAARAKVVTPFNGTWNLRDTKFIEGKKLSRYVVFMYGPQIDPRAVTFFFKNFAQMLTKTGLPTDSSQGMKPTAVAVGLKGVVQAASIVRKLKPPPEMIFNFLIGGRDPMNTYKSIKTVFETQLGIPSQCFDFKNIRNEKKSGPNYQANVALKVNAKLGGINNTLKPKLTIISERPTLLMGADVHHPPVGNLLAPSVAAVVGSYNRDATKYMSITQAQGHRVESIACMQQATETLLKNFKEQQKVRPEHIIMYRDGVGEGAFDDVLAREVRAIYRACANLNANYKPQVTYILCQKRNHVKMFPSDRKYADKEGRLLAGTVVDVGITSPFDFDFFLCSHAGLKGTSKPTRYLVLWDDAKLPTDKLLALTYELCYLYFRCTRAVSLPAPAFYAHLAAYRSHLYLPEADPHSRPGTTATPVLAEVLGGLKAKLYYA